MTAIDRDRALLARAIDLARACPPSDGAFSVGAILVAADGTEIATGYSREFGDAWHAEEVAIEKARRAGILLDGATIYASLEPCSLRKSRPASCCSLILAAGIARVVFCLEEPPLFVTGEGRRTLQAAGVDVLQIRDLADGVRAANAHLKMPED